jgi:DNA primase
MALPANFLDELRARTPLQVLVGRSVRLSRSGRESKGCCPFHSEKTPSFYVYDDHFHCFGCGEHGDAITFVMKSQGAGFMEAVEALAAEAGLEVPKASPAEAEREAKRASIHEVLQAAAKTYQTWLFAPEGAAALSYLRERGLAEATIKKFGLGWSGEGRGSLASALSRQNIKPEQLIEAGLMKQGDFGPVDMFFSRVMFPIQDRRGAIISFSGRIMGDGTPKYVNGPETPAFSKRRSLYGLNFAREAVRKGEALIIVEGQMDVIALAQAGFGGAVAPLGTALTEEQMAEIWHLSPEPVICFDADNAGRKAAMRAVDLALPALAPDRALKFLRLPEREDPDSLIRNRGAAAFKAQLTAAEPLSAVLFDMLAEGANRETPEGRAALRKKLLETTDRIADKPLAGEYRALLLDRFFAERRGGPAQGTTHGLGRNGSTRRNTPQFPPPRRPIRMPIDPAAADIERGRILTAILINHPRLLPDVEEAFALIELPPDYARLRDAFAKYHDCNETLDSTSLLTHLHESGLMGLTAKILAMSPLPACAAASATLAQAADGWWEMFGLMRASRNRLREQRDEQQRCYLANPGDPIAVEKLIKLNAALSRAERAEPDADG